MNSESEAAAQCAAAWRYETAGDETAARRCYELALELAPGCEAAINNLALLLEREFRFADAVACCRDGLIRHPDSPVFYGKLGRMLLHSGQAEEAADAFARAAELAPAESRYELYRVFCLNYFATDPEKLLQAHRQWGERYGRGMDAIPVWSKEHFRRTAGNKIRIAYFSPDFRTHPVMCFFEPLLAAHDRDRLEIHLVSDGDKHDLVTDRLKTMCDGWHETASMDRASAADYLRRQSFDILIDLAGYTWGRLDLLTPRVAPVQAAWLGYPNTSGYEAADWRLTDDLADPPEFDGYFTERLWRLPGGMWSYAPSVRAPEPSAAPVEKNDVITFGSFNNLAKLSTETVRLWAAVLRAVPGSRLLLKSTPLADAGVAAAVRARFVGNGVAADRLVLLPACPQVEDHLATYRDVDIALDPFPYNGTTTTFDSLWMGVPVLTFTGAVPASRPGGAILRRLGLDFLVAASKTEFVRKAAALASDAKQLTALRRSLRPLLASSSLCDGGRLARAMETAFTAWTRPSC